MTLEVLPEEVLKEFDDFLSGHERQKQIRHKECPECRGNKFVGALVGGSIIRKPCQECNGLGKVEFHLSADGQLDPVWPKACPRCRMDTNPFRDNFCWNCGVSVNNGKLHQPYIAPNESAYTTRCADCNSSMLRRSTRWGIFRLLPAWRWIWPLRRRIGYRVCHVCGSRKQWWGGPKPIDLIEVKVLTAILFVFLLWGTGSIGHLIRCCLQ